MAIVDSKQVNDAEGRWGIKDGTGNTECGWSQIFTMFTYYYENLGENKILTSSFLP